MTSFRCLRSVVRGRRLLAAGAFLFLGYPAQDGYALGDMDPVLLAVTVGGLLFFPVLGNLRPDLVSFLRYESRDASGNRVQRASYHRNRFRRRIGSGVERDCSFRTRCDSKYGQRTGSITAL